MNSCQFYSFRRFLELVPYFPFLLLCFRPSAFLPWTNGDGFTNLGHHHLSWNTFIINKGPHKSPFEWHPLHFPSSKGPGQALMLTLQWVSAKMKQKIPCNTEVAVSSGREKGIRPHNLDSLIREKKLYISLLFPRISSIVAKSNNLHLWWCCISKSKIQTELSLLGLRRWTSTIKVFCQKQTHLII